MDGTVTTGRGTLRGTTLLDGGVRRFLGIPYAAPPVGDLRWRPPQPPANWDGVREAWGYGPAASQITPAPTSLYYGWETTQSEDCLHLNVWTGSSSSEERPVLVWLHFGAFQFGSSSNPLYDGTRLAAQGATVVTVGYRLGRLGFLAHPALTQESEHRSSGNYGLMDQLQALRWVQENIAAFGGDPGNVTLIGCSAGAHSAYCLRSSPLAAGLFHKVIAHSGAGFTHAIDGPGHPAAMQTLAAAEQAGDELADALGVQTLAELRALPVEAILGVHLPRGAGVWNLSFLPPEITVGDAAFDSGYPVIDNHVLPVAPRDVWAAGNQIDVPMLAGSTGNESSGLPHVASLATYEEYVRDVFAERAGEMLRLYPAATDDEARRASGQLFGDRMFTWATWTATRLHAQTGTTPVYAFRFMHEPPLPPDSDIAERDNARAFHGAEIPYLFGTFGAWDWPWTAQDQRLGEVLSAAWLRFARTGDPNGAGLVDWPVFDAASPSALHLDTEPRMAPIPDRERLDLWDGYYAAWHGSPGVAQAAA